MEDYANCVLKGPKGYLSASTSMPVPKWVNKIGSTYAFGDAHEAIDYRNAHTYLVGCWPVPVTENENGGWREIKNTEPTRRRAAVLAVREKLP